MVASPRVLRKRIGVAKRHGARLHEYAQRSNSETVHRQRRIRRRIVHGGHACIAVNCSKRHTDRNLRLGNCLCALLTLVVNSHARIEDCAAIVALGDVVGLA